MNKKDHLYSPMLVTGIEMNQPPSIDLIKVDEIVEIVRMSKKQVHNE